MYIGVAPYRGFLPIGNTSSTCTPSQTYNHTHAPFNQRTNSHATNQQTTPTFTSLSLGGPGGEGGLGGPLGPGGPGGLPPPGAPGGLPKPKPPEGPGGVPPGEPGGPNGTP